MNDDFVIDNILNIAKTITYSHKLFVSILVNIDSKRAWNLFCRECAILGIAIKENANLKNQIAFLRELTPGDFAAVRRQHRFRPLTSANNFLERLVEEVFAKEKSAGAKMGFLQ